ncbi:MAG: DsrE family protein [Bacteroidota bacterium]
MLATLTLVANMVVSAQGNNPKPGPVFNNIGAVYDVSDADFIPEISTKLSAIFDIDRKQDDLSKQNPLISSLHRYYNMHVRKGIPKENIRLAFVLHGGSSKDALSDKAYQKRFGVKNPNGKLIESLSKEGVQMFICGQSAAYAGFDKSELRSEVKLALSAMTVITVYQMDGYSLIKF